MEDVENDGLTLDVRYPRDATRTLYARGIRPLRSVTREWVPIGLASHVSDEPHRVSHGPEIVNRIRSVTAP